MHASEQGKGSPSFGRQDLYVRMHASDLGAIAEHKVKIAAEVLSAILVVCGMFLLARYIDKVRARKGFEGSNITAFGHWKSRTKKLESPNEPSLGDYTWQITLYNYPESIVWKGSEKNYRTGLWNGLGYSGAPELKPNPLFNFEFVSNKDEVYYNCYLKNEFAKSRVVVDQTNGYTRNRYVCNSGTQSWEVFMSEPRDNCDRDDLCGAYGNCIIGESPVCKCLKGFKLKGNFMDCDCFKWFGDLNDIREFQDGGQDLCVRMHASELVVCCANIKCEGANGEDEVKIALEVLAVIFVICGMLLLAH
ncbi:hypothetical protein FEM48_Zijuj01G0214000 [Ziziphus jujuba var. spinosa]|uniref:EGF-like domain-containing protein n=1 Tax=Ziziphus jujuba var. spinosa TaxID=714518 RepID=A0A978W3M9_ZIZJJ|nr:hypothetical protein FEM48_Zijuj01G0214000 [Ziziphus jujuba var. spinosa]